MGLLSTAAIIAVIAIVIAGVAIWLLHPTLSTTLTKAKAVTLVLSDIAAKNPNANVTVINVSNSSFAGSWKITLGVIYNGNRPCPMTQIEQFDYPAIGLNPSTATQYSSLDSNFTCHVPLQTGESPFSLPLKSSIAIATSYASGVNAIKFYVNTFGYNNTFVTANFLGSSLNGMPAKNTNVWLIRYRAASANYSLYAVLGQSGMVIQTYNSSD